MKTEFRNPLRLLAALVIAFAVLPGTASAATLTLVEGAPIFQQVDNSPCVIGDPSCNNPATFSFTLIGPNVDSAILDSPTYTVQQIRDIVGDTFLIGIDINQAQDLYTLNAFTLTISGLVAFEFVGPEGIEIVNNGNGFSDATLQGFDLSSFSGSAPAFFTANFSGADAGREQFFLASGSNGPGSEIPEPASMALLVSGLVGLGARRRLRRS